MTTDQSLDGIYTGVFLPGAPGRMDDIHAYESITGKKVASLLWYADCETPFPLEAARELWKKNIMPHITWEIWDWSLPKEERMEKYRLKRILLGDFDKQIDAFATGVKKLGKPIFLRIFHEFNGDWYPWSIKNNQQDPGLIANAFRYVVDRFRTLRVQNVRWVWSPNNASVPSEWWNNVLEAYPGDDYVDWIGIDLYNFGRSQDWSHWEPFSELLNTIYPNLVLAYPDKPFMIGEMGCAEKGGDKSAWLDEMFNDLHSDFPNIRMLVWFNIRKEADWRVESSDESLQAFRNGISDPFFLTSGEHLADIRILKESIVKPTTDNRPRFSIHRLSGNILVDGDLLDWNKMPFQSISPDTFIISGEVPDAPGDLSAEISMAYDQENLYIAVRVHDDLPFVNSQKNGDLWNGDAMELCISTDAEANPNRMTFGQADHQFVISSTTDSGQPPVIWKFKKYGTQVAGPVQNSSVRTRKTRSGWILEARISWSFSPGFKPGPGMKTGFNFAIDDADKTGKRETQLIWAGGSAFYANPSLWGWAVYE